MYSTLKYGLVFWWLASAGYLPAQSLNQQYNFKQLNVQNGLVQNIVYHFLQDNKGYLWLGTRNGLTMYDGVSTINFQHKEEKKNSIASSFITRILEDSQHQLWIGNEKGIDLFNRTDNTFSHYGVDRPDGKKTIPSAFRWVLFHQRNFGFLIQKQNQYGHLIPKQQHLNLFVQQMPLMECCIQIRNPIPFTSGHISPMEAFILFLNNIH